MPSVSSWQTGTIYYDSVAYSAIVTGTSAVRLKVRLRLQGSSTLVYEYLHDPYGSGVRVGSSFSVSPNTSYYWEAQAYESASSYSVFEYCGGFTTPSAPPPPVVYPNTPSSLSTGTPTTTSISFQGIVSHPSGYNCKLTAEVYSNSGYSNFVTSSTTSLVSSGSYASGTISGLSAGTTYYWKAYTTDSNGNSSSSVTVGSFTTQSNLPNAPTSLSTGTPSTTSISFQGLVSSPQGLNCYLNAQVYSDSGYSNYVTSFNTGFVSSGSYASGNMSGLVAGATYYWKAYTTDSSYNNSSSVNVGSFTLVDDKPDTPTALSTGVATKNSITFTGNVSHDLGYNTQIVAQVYTNSSYTTLFNTYYTSYVSSGSSASGTFTGLNDGTTYYWKAYAKDVNGKVSATVTVGSFTTQVDANPNTPLIQDVYINPSSTTVQFSGLIYNTDGDKMYLKAYAFKDSAYTIPQGDANGYIGTLVNSGEMSTVTVNGLAIATNYYFQLQAVDNGGAKGSSRLNYGLVRTPIDWKWISGQDANGNKMAGTDFSMLATEWNSFTGMINQVRQAKGYSTVSFTVAVQNAQFTASMMNEAIGAINYMLGTGVSPKAQYDTIYASDLNKLKNTLNNVT